MFGGGTTDDSESSEGGKYEHFVKRWGWMAVVYQYSEFYKINVNEVYNVKLIEFFNYLAFMKDKGTFDMELAREQMKHNGR